MDAGNLLLVVSATYVGLFFLDSLEFEMSIQLYISKSVFMGHLKRSPFWKKGILTHRNLVGLSRKDGIR